MATFAIDSDRPVDRLRSFCNVNAIFDAKFNGRDRSMHIFPIFLPISVDNDENLIDRPTFDGW
jgi:hypothetical protein